MKLLILTLAAFLANPSDTAAQSDSTSTPEVKVTEISLEDALKIALSENVSVKVADMEIKRNEYAKKGTYASLFPQIDGSAAFQRTIKKQVMYMDFDMGSIMGGAAGGSGGESSPTSSGSSGGGLEVGRWNTWSAGVTASMPIINASLWESIKISGMSVELAVEKARGSRLEMITQVKSAYYMVLLARQAADIYTMIYENAKANLDVTHMKYSAQKASEMELMRAKTTVANALPNMMDAKANVDLALWQLKAVMGVDLDYAIDVKGSLDDYAATMFYDVHSNENAGITSNSSLRQLEMQVAQLARTIKLNQDAYIPSLAVAFNYTYNAMANNFNFSEYRWTPYSYVGLSLNIPIFSGHKRLYNIRQSKLQYEEAVLQKTQLERQLRIAVRSDLSTMENSMNSYYAAKSAAESAQKGYDITAESYRVGRSTLVELNDAMLALGQAHLTQCQAIFNFLSAKADLEQQLGQDFTENSSR